MKKTIDKIVLAEKTLDGCVNELEHFEREDAAMFMLCVIELRKYLHDSNRFLIVEKAYEDVKAFLVSTAEKADLLTTTFFNNLVMFYFFAFRVYLKHWEVYLKREKDENHLSEFKRLTSKEYDSSQSYRFAESMRNYIEHCQFPISHMNVSKLIPGKKRSVTAHANRKALLDFNWKPKELKMLNSYPEKINMVKVINESYAALKRVQTGLLRYLETRELYLMCIGVLALRKKYRKDENLIAMKICYLEASIFQDAWKYDMQHFEAPWSICKDIVKRYLKKTGTTNRIYRVLTGDVNKQHEKLIMELWQQKAIKKIT